MVVKRYEQCSMDSFVASILYWFRFKDINTMFTYQVSVEGIIYLLQTPVTNHWKKAVLFLIPSGETVNFQM